MSRETTLPAGADSGFAALRNPLAGPVPESSVPRSEIRAFHRRLTGYEPTPLLSVPALAERLGVARLLLKCESRRFGLPAFKMLGASWATYRALASRLGEELEPWGSIADLASALAPLRPFSLVAATDGNHGRAVARMARLLGLCAHIFVPAGTTRQRMAAISSEGAEVTVVEGNYDEAVERAAREESPRAAVISDTSWPGYTDVPTWVIEGYATMFIEVEEALEQASLPSPDLVVVPVGVGALAAAAVQHRQTYWPGSDLLGVEPESAACVAASVLAGKLTTLEGDQHSVMAGLNCGTPSPVAWPFISAGLTGLVTIGDGWAESAVRELAAVGVEAGETGAATLGGLDALARAGWRSELAGLLDPAASLLALVTEGASDPVAWRRLLGVELIGTTDLSP